MSSAVILLLVSLILIFLEFFLPGGIMGATGAVGMVVSVLLFALESPSPWLVMAYIVVAGLALAAVIKFALWRVRSGKGGYSVYLSTDQEGYKAGFFDVSALGKQGVALSDLKPSGHVKVEGKRHQAIAKTGYIERDTPIQVIEGRGSYLVVKSVKQDSE